MYILILIISIPVMIWFSSYIYLATHFRKLNLFIVKIHESGKYNFLETVFYFDHFIREIPIDTLYTLCIFWVYANLKSAVLLNPSIHSSIFPVLFTLFMCFVYWSGYMKKGWVIIYDFLQYRELDNVKNWGSHWQMHFASTLFLILLFIFPGSLIPIKQGEGLIFIFSAFIFFSLIFRVDKSSITNKRWVMHGLREIFTFGIMAFLPFYTIITPDLVKKSTLNQVLNPYSFFLVVILTILSIHQLKIYTSSNIKNLSRAKVSYNTAGLLASHFFEHFLDFVYMFLLLFTLNSLLIK